LSCLLPSWPVLHFDVAHPGPIALTDSTWTPAAGTWYHPVLAFDAVSRAGTLYLNGRPVATQSAEPGFVIGYGQRNLEIGRDNDNGSWTSFFSGGVGEVSMYYRALTASDIAP